MTPKTGSMLLFAGLYCALAGWTLHAGPAIHPDSAGYIHGDFLRAPLYPLLIDLFNALFGDGFHLKAVACFQILLAMLGMAAFSLSLKRHFALSNPMGGLVFLLTTVPLLKFGSSILTEAVAYGLHGAFMAVLLHHIFTRDNRLYGPMLLLAGLELLVRPQFFFVFVFLAVYAMYNFLVSRKPCHLVMAVAVLCLWSGLFLVRNAYNAANHGYFGQYSAIGEHHLATQLYLSTPEDIALFTDPDQREFLTRLYRRIDREQLSLRHWDYTKSHYNKSLTTLYFQHILPVYGDMFNVSTPSDIVKRDTFCKELGTTLLKHNPLRYAKLVMLKLYHGPFNYMVLFFILAPLAAIWHTRTGSRQSLAYLAVSTLTLFNYGMLLPFAIIANRYTLFTDIYQFALTGACGLWLLAEYGQSPETKE